MTRTEGFSALTSICGSLGALHCVVPTFHASWPTVQRLADTLALQRKAYLAQPVPSLDERKATLRTAVEALELSGVGS